MSFKTLFNKAVTVKSLANKSAEEIGAQVESVGYHTQDILQEERFIPHINFSDPKNFARFGSAEEYYTESLERIYGDYPYDGSLKERLKWENESTYLDLHIYNNLYPRTNGYIIFSADGWGAGSIVDGYGSSSSPEYIYFKGGPHAGPGGMDQSMFATNFTGSNYYEPSKNRENNLKFDLQNNGVSVEFWLKKDEFITGSTEKEVIFDLWNGVDNSDATYGRLTIELSGTTAGTDPFLVTILSGTYGDQAASVCASTFTTASVADGNWHHYAFSFISVVGVPTNTVTSRFYVDGELNNETSIGTKFVNEVTGALRAYIGALISSPTGSSAAAGAGKLSGSLDEFRYWKTRRSSKDIGRFWFTQVGGGVNSDPTPFTDTQENVNTNLGVYYKFNEGITGTSSIDSTVLDYSGRVTNGNWTGYDSSSRNTGSAIVLSNAAIKEFKDPIIYSFHPEVVALRSGLSVTGSTYDAGNNASIYNSIPAWITEEDIEGRKQLKYLTQIMSSYLDSLHLQMDTLNRFKDISYVSGSEKPLPFSEKLLNSNGFVSPEIFLDADILEVLADRSEDRVYEKSLNDIKNIIYKNIYNNLTYIFKSKGTEKAFRNLIRCFGIDDELIKLNLYAKNTNYQYRENRRNIVVADKSVNFNTAGNKTATVYGFYDSDNTTNTSGFITSSAVLTGGYANTVEVDLFFPEKPSEVASAYFNTNAISSSLFGVHGALSETDTTWSPVDVVNFQVFTARDEKDSANARFVLTGTAGGFVPTLISDLYEDLYQSNTWNVSVAVKPENYPLVGQVAGADTGNYTVVFRGIQTDSGEIINSFALTGSVASPASGFVTGSKRVFLGAHRTNFTGTVLQTSDVRVSSARYWLKYLDLNALIVHAYDTENHGPLHPASRAFDFNTSASYGEALNIDTLAFNWEFSQNTGSDAAGEFEVADESSGSATLASSRFGPLGTVLNIQHTAKGTGFEVSSTSPIKKDHIISSKLNPLEVISSIDQVKVLTLQEQQVFSIDSRPVNYFFSFEKSMYRTITEEMVNSFGTLRDFNNIMGEAVNRYRPNYKMMTKLRNRFFEKVSNNEIDFDKFYEFYKWFDSSLSFMLNQLVPISADFAENIRTMIENHALERNKYQSRVPFLDTENMVFSGAAESNVDYGGAISSPDDDLTGLGFWPSNAPTRRALGQSTRALIKQWRWVHAPIGLSQAENYLWWKNEAERTITGPIVEPGIEITSSKEEIFQIVKQTNDRTKFTPYRFMVEGGRTAGGGTGAPANKRVNAVFAETQPFGPETCGNAIENLMVAHSSGVEQLLNTSDIFYPSYKQRLGIQINPSINNSTNMLENKTNGLDSAPFSVYSSSLSNVSVFKEGIALTNLHHDFVSNTDIPLQGHFTEKFVGGRFYRHTELNDATDTAATRGEGWKIQLSDVTSLYGAATATTVDSPALTNTIDLLSRLVTYGSTDNGGMYTASADGTDIDSFIACSSSTAVLWFSASNNMANEPGAPIENPGGGIDWGDRGLFSWGGVISSTYQRRITFQSASGGPTFSVYLTRDTTASEWAKTNFISTSGWYNIAVVHDDNGASGGTITVYLNGEEVTPTSTVTGVGLLKSGSGPTQAAGLFNYKYFSSGLPLVDTQMCSASFGSLAFYPEAKNSAFITPQYQLITTSSYDCADRPAGGNLKGSIDYSTGDYAAPMWYRPSSDTDVSGTILENEGRAGPFGWDPANPLYDWAMIANFQNNTFSVLDTAEAAGGTWAKTWALPPFQNSLAIIPPNSRGGPTVASIPTAQRFRDETAKRPINIKNILMTTASLGTRLSGVIDHNRIGNYSKNYEVIESCGRSTNDLYFREQTFDFALYPQNPYLRLRNQTVTRQPLQDIRARNTKATYLTSSACYDFDADLVSEMNTNSAETWIFWMNCTQIASLNYIFADEGADERYILMSTTEILAFKAFWSGGNAQWNTDAAVTTGNEWIHVAITYDGTSTANNAVFYINGEEVASSRVTSAPIGTLDPYEGDVNIGFHNGNGFKGYMSDVAFYNTTLTGEEIAAIYGNSTLDLINYGPPRVASNLIFWWRMGNSSGDSAGTIVDQMGNANLSSVNSPTINDIDPSDCLITANDNNFALPDRTGTNSNQTIFVNRFAGSGYEVMSRGFLDPAHEEMSVYNALPYHNLSVIDYGLSGSASVDPIAAETITVIDQLDKNRGLDQRATLHSAQFGIDAAYGSITPTSTRVDGGLGYSITPSWHKTNRNTKLRMESSSAGYVTASVYDNLFVQHAIPRSEDQYSWITASLEQGKSYFGFLPPNYLSASVLSKLLTIGQYPQSDFVGLRTRILDAASTETRTLGFSLSAASSSYINTEILSEPIFATPVEWFNNLMLNRNGPYQYPMWKQVRTNQTPVARKLKESNMIGAVVPPPLLPKIIASDQVGYMRGLYSNEAVNYIEQPISSRHFASLLISEGTGATSTADDQIYEISYGNNLDRFSHESLNNRLHLIVTEAELYNNPLMSAINYVVDQGYSILFDYGERIYPPEHYAYRNIVRNRTRFSIAGIWDPSRSITSGRVNSQGHTIPNMAAWPLRENEDFSTAVPLLSDRNDGSGELQNVYSRYGITGSNDITASAQYAMRVPVGFDGSGNPVYGGVSRWQVGPQADKVPYQAYNIWVHQLRLKAKDYSIVPEFRISEHIENIVNSGSNPLINWRLDLTGAAISDSDQPDFFKTYTNADFMKYFDVVDDAVYAAGTGDQQVIRNKVSLRCHAAIKFLPYKGFYPIERMQFLAQRFSQSYGAFVSASYPAAYRALLEPLAAPGIINNTYKSGLAVGSWVTTLPGGLDADVHLDISNPLQSQVVDSTNVALPEGIINFGSSSLLSGSPTPSIAEYQFKKIPFEAMYRPSYLDTSTISGSYIYDSGVGSASLSGNTGGSYIRNRVSWTGDGDPLYQMAADNFLCETYNIFTDDPVSFISKKEDEFSKNVKKGDKFALTFNVYRTLDETGSADRSKFKLYERASAFGAPFVLDTGSIGFGVSAGGYIDLTASISGGTPATGAVRIGVGSSNYDALVGSDAEIFLTSSQGNAYTFTFFDKEGNDINPAVGGNIATGSSNSAAAINLASGINASNFVIIDGGVADDSVEFFVAITQSAIGASGNGHLTASHMDVGSQIGLSGGVDGVASFTQCDKWTISDGGTDGGAATAVTFAMSTTAGGSSCEGVSVDDTFIRVTSSALTTAANFVAQINSYSGLNITASSAGDASTTRISLVNLGTGSIGNVTISSVVVSASSYALGGMSGGLNGRYTYPPSLAPNLPSYYYGKSSVTILCTASFAGSPSLSELLATAEYIYSRDMETNSYSVDSIGYRLAQQVSESFNLNELLVPDAAAGAASSVARWAIQSKFETPVLNFADVSYNNPPNATTPIAADAVTKAVSVGIGHQYGAIPSGDAGIFVNITTPDLVVSPTLGRIDQPYSLAGLVGFPEGVTKRVGKIKTEHRFEEAVVVVPYIEIGQRRKFLTFPWKGRKNLGSYQSLLSAMDKYIFPPKFDFTRFKTVNPVLMYIFEFGKDLTQTDISDIWQSLPPGYTMSDCELCGCTNAEFDMKEIVVEEKQLINKILSKDKDLHWMVFKVKRRAKKDFEIQRRRLLTDDISTLEPTIGEYSYNWPYDYFSIVELIKIDQTVRYLTKDLGEDDCEVSCEEVKALSAILVPETDE